MSLERFHESSSRWILQRGAACANCRRKKHKCDGERPACGRCVRTNGAAECVYSTVVVPRVQDLQERLQMLEKQLQTATSSQQSSSSTGLRLSARPAPSPALNLDIFGCWWEEDTLPIMMKEYLLDLFVQNRRSMVFEFNVARLQAEAAIPQNQPDSIHPALMNAIYLLACYFGPTDLSEYQPVFLRRLRKSLDTALENVDRLFDFLRAYALVGIYYYLTGRVSEGHFHISAAARFAVGCGFHQITPRLPTTSNFGLIAPPKDDVELGDRVHTFWFIYLWDCCGSLWCGLPPSIAEEEIETPWPRPMENYERGLTWGERHDVLRAFFAENGSSNDGGDTVFSQRMKSATLLDRATRLFGQAKAGPMKEELSQQIHSTRQTISNYIASLPPSPLRSESEDLWHASLFSRNLAFSATIFIEGIFATDDITAYERRLSAARHITETSRYFMDTSSLRPPLLIGLSWVTASDTLARERERLERLSLPGTEVVQAELESLMEVMMQMIPIYPAMKDQVSNNRLGLTSHRLV